MKNIILVFLVLFGMQEIKAQNKVVTDTIATSTVCGTCKSILDEGLKFEKGVIRVTVLVEEQKIILKYRSDKTNRATLKATISRLGYRADDVPADPKGFEALPACCKKPHDD
jgi:periplasmic mercuric ion binding protein